MSVINKSFKNKTSAERADIKALEICKTKLSKFEKEGFEIEIVGDINKIEGGVEVFAKAFKNGKSVGFGKDGTVEIERFRFFNPPVLVDDENGDIIRESIDGLTKEVKQRKLKYDPEEATKQSLAHTILQVAKDGKNIVKGEIGNTTSIFYASEDAYVQRADVNQTWANINSGAGTGVDRAGVNLNFALIHASITSNQWQRIDRSIIVFDTSSLPDTDTIDSAVLSLFGTAKLDNLSVAPNVDIYTSTPTDDTNIDAADYSQVGTTSQTGSPISYASYSASAYNDFTFNATGKGNISKTGKSKFSVRNANYEVSGSAPSWTSNAISYCQSYSVDQTGTANDPKLVVEHSVTTTNSNFFQLF